MTSCFVTSMARTTKTDVEANGRVRFPKMDRRPQGSRDSDLPDLLDKTIAVWQPRTQRTLTREDAREIVSNVMGFFAVLNEWDRAERFGADAPTTPEKSTARSVRGPKRKRTTVPGNSRQDAAAEPHDLS